MSTARLGDYSHFNAHTHTHTHTPCTSGFTPLQLPFPPHSSSLLIPPPLPSISPYLPPTCRWPVGKVSRCIHWTVQRHLKLLSGSCLYCFIGRQVGHSVWRYLAPPKWWGGGRGAMGTPKVVVVGRRGEGMGTPKVVVVGRRGGMGTPKWW